MTDTCKADHWQAMALTMRNFVVMNGLYVNAPAFYQVEDVVGEPEQKTYSVYVPVNASIRLDDEIPMEFMEELHFDDALTFRVADIDTSLEEIYFLLETCAHDQGYGLMHPFYHVCFDVFGEAMIDVVAPIVKAEQDV
jgi:hypothetical protein